MFTTCALLSQEVKLGIKGGLNLSNFIDGDVTTPMSEGYSMRVASGASIFTELQINKTFAFRFGVEYNGMGGTKNGMQALPTQRLITEMAYAFGMSITEEQIMALGLLSMNMSPYYYANIENIAKFDYVTIPILAQVGTNLGQSSWRVYLNAGPFVSLLLSGKQDTRGTSKLFADPSGTTTLWSLIPDEAKKMIALMQPELYSVIENTISSETSFGETNITGELRSANFGIIGNVGLRFQHKSHCFFVEGGGNYGFQTVQEESTNGNNKIYATSIMFGYAFSLR